MSDDKNKNNVDDETLETLLENISTSYEEGIDASIVEGEPWSFEKQEKEEEKKDREERGWKDIAPVPEMKDVEAGEEAVEQSEDVAAEANPEQDAEKKAEETPEKEPGILTAEEREAIEDRREKRAENTKKQNRRSYLTDFLIVVVLVLVLSFFVKAIVVQGISMEPTLKTSDYILISRQAYKFGSPKRGDIIVFPHFDGAAEKLYVKRVIAIPGDRIVIYKDKLWINGKEKHEKYIKEPEVIGEVNKTIPEGEIFVMGDNRNNSADSRIFGTVPIEDVTGKVFVRLYPFNEMKVFK